MNSDIRLVDVPVISSLDDPEHGWKYHAIEMIESISYKELMEHTDEVETAHELMVSRANETKTIKHWVLALRGPDDNEQAVVGWAKVALQILDNQDKAEIWVCVPPDQRQQGVGTLLSSWCEDLVAQSGRNLVMAWVLYTASDEGPPYLQAPDGTLVPCTPPRIQFLIHRGYDIALVERRSVLAVPMDPDLSSQLMDAALPSTQGYRLHTWSGDIPEEWLESFCHLMAVFSLDAPMGTIDWEEEKITPDIVRRQLQDLKDKDNSYLITVAEDCATGELVGCTELRWPNEATCRAVEQWTTIVLRAHRGHRLGMWMKLTNLAAMIRLRPDTERVFTYNAEQNSPMLAINVAMGFSSDGGVAFMKKSVDSG
ncbi:MAG: hypothetical protein FWD55_00070 [Propionibacteriaceae bacterium]|nr:hypothetical protein [Propionibacteriaceae bacterium]